MISDVLMNRVLYDINTVYILKNATIVRYKFGY